MKQTKEAITCSLCTTDNLSPVTPQTSSYGGRASEKGKPDLQCRREESAGVFQPGGEKEEREQDPVQLQGDGVQENQRQGGEVNITFVLMLPVVRHPYSLSVDYHIQF